MTSPEILWSNASILQLDNLKVQFSAVYETDEFDPTTHQDGIFRVSQWSSANKADFDGVARLWRVPAAGFSDDSDPATADMFTVVAELSWPAQVPYEQRDTSVYSLDLFRPAVRSAMTFAGADEDGGDGADGGHSNNGHGNNEDGVDVSNPGQGGGGPNGEEDPSGDIDDEIGNGGGTAPAPDPVDLDDGGVGHDNNGHGNNEDGVDVSNPGAGLGGPNGEEDPSGEIDDEIGNGNSNGNN